MEQKLPLPPFTLESAKQKIQLAEDAWNSKDPERVSKAYTINSEWRNRHLFINGREEIVKFLTEKWKKEIDYTLKKEYWAHTDNRIAVRFEYEYQNAAGQWFRAYGNENWEFDENGLMTKRYASINDLPIKASERKLKTNIMKNSLENEKIATTQPVVIPDECGDSMWETVLEQPAFVQALQQAAKAVAEDKKDAIS